MRNCVGMAVSCHDVYPAMGARKGQQCLVGGMFPIHWGGAALRSAEGPVKVKKNHVDVSRGHEGQDVIPITTRY